MKMRRIFSRCDSELFTRFVDDRMQCRSAMSNDRFLCVSLPVVVCLSVRPSVNPGDTVGDV